MSLNSACLAVASVVRNVSGIRQGFDYPPDNPNAFPLSVVYPLTGTHEAAPIGTRRGLHSITIDVLEPQQSETLDRFFARFIPFVDSVPAALLAEIYIGGGRFAGTVDTFESVTHTFIPVVNYAAEPMRGYRFTMNNVKILTNQ